jgi:hypothetical protein
MRLSRHRSRHKSQGSVIVIAGRRTDSLQESRQLLTSIVPKLWNTSDGAPKYRLLSEVAG